MEGSKYYQLENKLRAEIESEAFEPGDRFYSITELIDRFGVSSITVNRAVSDLVAEGLLVRQQGRGNFVSRSRRQRPVFLSEIEVFSSTGEKERTEVLSLTFPSQADLDSRILDELGLGRGEAYGIVKRVRSFRGTPFQFQTSYICDRYLRRDVDPSYYTSIYRRFREDFNMHLSHEASWERVRITQDVPDEVLEALDVAAGVPCVFKEHRTVLSSGVVAEYVEMYKRWDYFELLIEEKAR